MNMEMDTAGTQNASAEEHHVGLAKHLQPVWFPVSDLYDNHTFECLCLSTRPQLFSLYGIIQTTSERF